ncbi:MAG: hypothetical protein Q4C34_04640 [Bacteroidales bacterium]|nr:hypothetical protein [Bacteroidales bacterium]
MSDNLWKINRVLLLLALIVTAGAGADARRLKSEKDYRKVIARYDVADTVLRAPDAGAFWSLVQQTTPHYSDVVKSLQGDGDRDIKREMVQVLFNAEYYFANVAARNDLANLADSMIIRSGIRDINPLCMLTVTRDNDVAAFGYPNGYIFMTGELVNAAAGDTTVLTAVLAGQLVHYTLQHAYDHALWERGRRRKKKFWKGVATAALVAADALAAAATDSPSIIYLPVGSGDIAPKYNTQYTPDQILEADIIAYRYMQWAGYGDNAYIDMLRRVGYAVEASAAASGENDKHMPRVDQRIAMLEYMRDNPSVRQRVKNAGRKPRPAGSYTDLINIRRENPVSD